MQKNHCLIIAHRAGNSINTFLNAVNDGADIIEVDVHLTRDGVLVSQYLPYIADSAGENMYFSNFDYADYVNPPSLLRDVLLLAKSSGVRVLLDIKKGSDFYPDIGAKISELVESVNMCSSVEAVSFDHMCIAEIKRMSKMRAGIMYVARLACLKEILLAVKPDFIEVCGEYLDESTVKIAQSVNVDVYGWGTDDAAVLQYYNQLGMKAVTVNDVKLAHEILTNE